MEQIGPSLDHLLGKTGLKKQLKSRQFFSYWPKVVGNYIKNYTRPLTIKENILWVEVTDSTWFYHLTMIKLKIIADFNTFAGQDLVKDIKFVNADFQSEKNTRIGINRKISSKKIGLEAQKVAFLMKEEEKNELYSALQQSPPYFQSPLEKMFQICYFRQRLKKEKGAKACKNCGIYVWEDEFKEELCPFCYPLIETWLGPLKVLFHREPWLRYADLHPFHPSLDYNIFLLCKERIITGYAERLTGVMSKSDLDKQIKRKILSRLAQRYVMLVEEKKPEEIALEQVFKTLKPFPGLYQYLNEHYTSK
jgi:hypothetical protein